MRPNEAFKLGFMVRCVENGLTAEGTRQLIKVASFYLGSDKQANFWNGAIGAVKSMSGLGLGLAGLGLAAPPATGALAAYLVNKSTDADSNDVNEIKKKELIQAYRRMTDQLQRQHRLRDQRASGKSRSQVYL